ncbi:hypothetical protein GF389_03165 [Candidatus Dojkabacteria bacterium]|nr:hypothetical protein [Candidatus Dojkabacteria bacterium]
MNSKRISKEQVSKSLGEFLERNWLIFAIPLLTFLSVCSLITLLGNDNLWRDVDLGLKSGTTNDNQQFENETVIATIEGREGIKLELEVADSEQQRNQGLMDRNHLEQNHGMLFVFGKEQNLQFWMKNTYIPLDIAFLDSDKKIINIHKNTEPLNSSIRYRSDEPAKYAVETNSGWFARNDVNSGDSFKIFPE